MLYGVGFKSDTKTAYPSNHDKCYVSWKNMLKRCYSKEKKYENYKILGVKVCDEWKDFVEFRKWFEENFYQVKDEQMDLDKDILLHGNLIYSPERCIFVPKRINALFVKSKIRRGPTPIGVYFRKGKYFGSCSVNGKNVRKAFNTEAEAFEFYKEVKENHIKDIANEYKPYIPNRLYQALCNYEVKEDD